MRSKSVIPTVQSWSGQPSPSPHNRYNRVDLAPRATTKVLRSHARKRLRALPKLRVNNHGCREQWLEAVQLCSYIEA